MATKREKTINFFPTSFVLFFRIRDKHPGSANINKDTKPLMPSLLVFNRVYGLEIQSVMLVFSNSLVN
jgi:hypothetical protein